MAVRSTQGQNRAVRSTQGGRGVTLTYALQQFEVKSKQVCVGNPNH